MKSKVGYWRSLEIYTWRVVSRSPLPYPYLVIGLGLTVVLTSLFGKSLVGVMSVEAAIARAAETGDYRLAERLYLTGNQQVLGARTDLVELVYPELEVEARIEELVARLVEYPGNREIFLGLARLYRQIGKEEEAEQYQEMARILDPNE